MSASPANVVYAALLGQLVAQLGWIDALFIPLVLVAPPVTGAILASRRVRYAWVAVIMPLLAGAGWGLVRITHRRRVSAA